MGLKEGGGLYERLKFGEGGDLALWYWDIVSCIGAAWKKTHRWEWEEVKAVLRMALLAKGSKQGTV